MVSSFGLSGPIAGSPLGSGDGRVAAPIGEVLAVAEAVIFLPLWCRKSEHDLVNVCEWQNRSLVLNRIGRPSLRDDWGQC